MCSAAEKKIDNSEATCSCTCNASIVSPRKVQRRMSFLPSSIDEKGRWDHVSPEDLLEAIHWSYYRVHVPFHFYSTLQGFFEEPTQEEIDAYDHDILNAVRDCDMGAIQRFHNEGRPLKCSNKFGESILHLACRKGKVDVVKFLLQKASVPCQVRDDYGRNPLHDAFWNPSPNYEVIDLLIGKCPDLLYIKDRRGFTPLTYARKEHWDKLKSYLSHKTPEDLAPRFV